MHVWFDFSLTKFITLAPKIGFKLGSVHRHLPFSMWDNPTRRRTMGQLIREVE